VSTRPVVTAPPGCAVAAACSLLFLSSTLSRFPRPPSPQLASPPALARRRRRRAHRPGRRSPVPPPPHLAPSPFSPSLYAAVEVGRTASQFCASASFYFWGDWYRYGRCPCARARAYAFPHGFPPFPPRIVRRGLLLSQILHRFRGDSIQPLSAATSLGRWKAFTAPLIDRSTSCFPRIRILKRPKVI
jgi:hypothetical protein